MDISQTTTRVSVVQYSDNSNLVIKLTDNDNIQDLVNAISVLVHTDGSRNVASAIQLAQLEIGDVGRVGVTRIIYVITSGPSNNPQLSLNAAQAARDNDIAVVAIGVGDTVNQDELEAIASLNLVFTANDFQLSSLRVIHQDIINSICTQG